MFKRVDTNEATPIEGFSYINKSGEEEAVTFEDDTVYLMYAESNDALSVIFVEDIPNLIKALQAAYDYKKGTA